MSVSVSQRSQKYFVLRSEKLFEVVTGPVGSGHHLPASFTAAGSGTIAHLRRRNVLGVKLAGPFRHATAEEFRYQNIRQSAMDIDRHIPANLGDPHVNASVTYANSLVNANVRIERNMDRNAASLGVIMPDHVAVNLSDLINYGI